VRFAPIKTRKAVSHPKTDATARNFQGIVPNAPKSGLNLDLFSTFYAESLSIRHFKNGT
jgi:hypothetical protein